VTRCCEPPPGGHEPINLAIDFDRLEVIVESEMVR
jgi:hypothetical protein